MAEFLYCIRLFCTGGYKHKVNRCFDVNNALIDWHLAVVASSIPQNIPLVVLYLNTSTHFHLPELEEAMPKQNPLATTNKFIYKWHCTLVSDFSRKRE